MNKVLSLHKGDLVYAVGKLSFRRYNTELQFCANLTEIAKIKRSAGSVKPSADEIDNWGDIDGPYAGEDEEIEELPFK